MSAKSNGRIQLNKELIAALGDTAVSLSAEMDDNMSKVAKIKEFFDSEDNISDNAGEESKGSVMHVREQISQISKLISEIKNKVDKTVKGVQVMTEKMGVSSSSAKRTHEESITTLHQLTEKARNTQS